MSPQKSTIVRLKTTAIRTAFGTLERVAPDLGARWGSAAVSLALVLIGLGVALAGYRRWSANEAAIRVGEPLPASWLMPTVTAAVAAVVVVVAVLVGVEVLGR